MKKRALACLMAGVLILGSVGCGGSAPQGNEAEQTTEETGQEENARNETESTEDTASEPKEVDWRAPYDETVTLTVAMASVAYEFADGDDLTNNIWTRDYKEKMNVEVVTDWISDEYDTKLNLAIASGDLPDVFTVDNVQLTQLMEAGLIADLTDVYETFASERLKEIEEGEPEVFATAQKDGRIYAIPSLYAGYQPNLLWLRQDWMKELGKEFPKTVEELEDILMDMKDLSKGGYSFSTPQDLTSLYGLAPAWGAYPEIWVEGEDGRAVYGAVAPEMKEAVSAWARWYQEGILKKDFATMNSDAVKEEVVAGNAGAETHGSWWGWTYGIDMVKNLGEEAYFMPCELPTVSGEKALYPMKFLNERYIVVNKNCENPEAAIKLIDWYVYINNDALDDMEQEEIELHTANNMQHVTKPFTVLNPKDDYSRYAMIAQARDTGDRTAMKTAIAVECHDGAMKWMEDKNPDGIGYALQFGMKGCGMDVLSGVTDEDRVARSRLWGASPQTLLDYGSTLNDILLEGFTKIIMGTEDADYFDTLTQQWYAAGGQDVTDAVNEMYHS